jgi:hypothetical protein
VPGPRADVALQMPRLSWARLDAGPVSPRGPPYRRSARRRWAPSSAWRAPSSWSPPSGRRSSRARPARVPELDGGSPGPPAAVAAAQPADAAGRPHARARDPRHRVAGGRAVRAAGPAGDRLERRGGDARRPAARAAAVPDRRLQLHALRAHAGDLRRQPIHGAASHGATGPRVPLLQLAPSPVALRPALHPAHRGPRAAPAPHRLLGVEGGWCWPVRWGPWGSWRSPRDGSVVRRRRRSRSSA